MARRASTVLSSDFIVKLNQTKQNKNTFLKCLVNKYRLTIPPERLYEPFRRISTKIRTAGRLVVEGPCPADGHLDTAIKKNCSSI